MSRPPIEDLRFRWRWRPYQRRVLESIEGHLHDDRLHLVAAPGAGKTSLGLEVFRRLGRPALVLAPTLTIRNQWLKRLEDFLPPGDRDRPGAISAWTSTDLDAPGFFTAATYQALLAKAREPHPGDQASEEDDDEQPVRAPSDEEVGALLHCMRTAEIGTLILDEAHHLKRAWWRALQSVVDQLDSVTLLSLTGTPPYDATGVEWRRYEELCGPIDEEISVPELVKAKTLCAHQDFVYAVEPLPAEVTRVRDHDRVVAELLRDLLDDPRFQGEIDRHPWVIEGDLDLDAVLGAPEVAVAILGFLRHSGAGLPTGLLHALGLTPADLPALSGELWEVLLREYLFGKTFVTDRRLREELTRRLRGDGLLWRRTFRIARSNVGERIWARVVPRSGPVWRFTEPSGRFEAATYDRSS